MSQSQAAIPAKESQFQVLECFGFRGCGGFTITTPATSKGDLLDNLYASAEYQRTYRHPHHHWAEQAPIPECIPAGTWTFGYRLTDDPYEHGGSGEGEYYWGRTG
jgi:hypothetical protein